MGKYRGGNAGLSGKGAIYMNLGIGAPKIRNGRLPGVNSLRKERGGVQEIDSNNEGG